MNDCEFSEMSLWITESALAGRSEAEMLAGVCEREAAAGLPITRAIVLIDTLHPVYNGRAFRWTRAQKETTPPESGRSDDARGRWQRSPFSQLEQSGEPMLRRRLTAQNENEFSIFPEFRADGITDYIALARRLAGGGT